MNERSIVEQHNGYTTEWACDPPPFGSTFRGHRCRSGTDMSIPRKRRYPMRPIPKRITITYAPIPSGAEVIKRITAAIKAGRSEKWQGDA